MRRFVLAFLWLFAAAAHAETVWTHNGSIMSLGANGSARWFYYVTPRDGLPVSRGTILFRGSRTGNRYSGTAYVFSERCGAVSYQVSGPVSPDERGVTMYGRAPQLSTNCRVVGYRDDVLVFAYVSSGEEEGGMPADGPWLRNYTRLKELCFSAVGTESEIDTAIEACDKAIDSAYEALSSDQSPLSEQRATLVRQREQLASNFVASQSYAPQAYVSIAPTLPATPIVPEIEHNSLPGDRVTQMLHAVMKGSLPATTKWALILFGLVAATRLIYAIRLRTRRSAAQTPLR